MKFTNEVKQFFGILFVKNGKDAIKISLVPHRCGGKGLDLQCIKLDGESYKEIDGLKVVISPEDEELLEPYIISSDDNGNITVMLEHPHQCNCGCCGDGNEHECNCGTDGCNCGSDCNCGK